MVVASHSVRLNGSGMCSAVWKKSPFRFVILLCVLITSWVPDKQLSYIQPIIECRGISLNLPMVLSNLTTNRALGCPWGPLRLQLLGSMA